MPPRVFQYGLLAPFDMAPVREQMRLAHRYRNKLTEIERERRFAARKALSSHPEYEQLRLELEAAMEDKERLRQSITTTRAKHRGICESSSQKEDLKTAARRVRELALKVKAAREIAYADPEVKAGFESADLHAKNRHKDARKHCGVYWGTYLLVEAAFDMARKSKDIPRFVREGRGGRLGVQIQKGIPADALFGPNHHLRILPVDPKAWDPSSRRCERRKANRTRMYLRVGSDRGKPIWVCFPMVMHRPLPPGAIVKGATVRCVPYSVSQLKWYVDILVDVPETYQPRQRASEGRVAINLGFCQRPDGSLRAGYAVGDDGVQREILVPFDRKSSTGSPTDRPTSAGVIDRLNKAASIQGFRAKNQDEMHGEFMKWLNTERERRHELLAKAHADLMDQAVSLSVFAEYRDRSAISVLPLPDTLGESFRRLGIYRRLASDAGLTMPWWFSSRTRTIHAWKSPWSFVQLAMDWRRQRFSGDAVGYDLLEAWRHRNDHLDRYQNGLAKKALGHRREIFRVIAANLARKYRTLVIDDSNLSLLVRREPVGQNHIGFRLWNQQQSASSGSQLREALKNAFGKTDVVVVSAVNGTCICHVCGTKTEVGIERDHTCGECGATWDQDYNACRNYLARERAGADEGRETARDGKTPIRKAYRSERFREAKAKQTLQ